MDPSGDRVLFFGWTDDPGNTKMFDAYFLYSNMTVSMVTTFRDHSHGAWAGRDGYTIAFDGDLYVVTNE